MPPGQKAEPHGVYCGQAMGHGTNHPGEGRCKLHGGRQLVGEQSPHFKDGTRSKYSPKRYRDHVPRKYLDAYDQSMNDPVAQREHSRQLSVISGIERELLDRMGTGESGEVWRRLQEITVEVKALLRPGRGDGPVASAARADAMGMVEGELLPLISQGVGEESARQEYVSLVQRRSKLIRVQQQGERTIDVEVVGVMLARWAAIQSEVVTEKVRDPKLVRDILNALVTRTRIETPLLGGGGMVRRIEAREEDAPATIEATGRMIG